MAFNNIVDSATVSEPTYTASQPLNTNTTYYWRVQAGNSCGNSAMSAPFSFSTVPAPGDCASSNQTNAVYAYGFETGAQGWTSSGTGNTWAQSEERANSGTFSWMAVDPVPTSDQRLVSPVFSLPSDEPPLTLQFFHYRDIEENATTGGCWDAGILEVSTNGGGAWTQLQSSVLLTDPYTGTVTAGTSTNPLAGLQGWCNLQPWTKSIVDIDAYAGQSAQFRFRLGSDGSVGAEGWYVDDVRIQSCLNEDILFRNGFE